MGHVISHVLLVFTEAVNNIVNFLGMQPCERSDKVPENKNSHTLFLAGKMADHSSRQRFNVGTGATCDFQ